MVPVSKTALRWFVGTCVLFPLFFQLNGGIYNDYVAMIDSLGALTRLPLPISLFACLAIFALLPGNFQRIHVALAMIAGVVLVSLVSLWFGGDGVTSPQRKLLLMVQILLPLAGLLLGQLIEDRQKIIARAFLIVLSLVVPLQLLATWAQGGLILTHYLYVFSIYSHFQYVTLIFVCAYAFALTSLWDEHKTWLCVLALAMLIYVLAGLSFLTIAAFVFVILGFSIQKFWEYRKNSKQILISLLLLTAAAAGGVIYFDKIYARGVSSGGDPYLFNGKFKRLTEGKVPINLSERFEDWRLFGNGIIESPKTILVGHPQPMPREIRSSPHNWYIDTAYTFGFLGLLPLLVLIGYTAYLCWTKRKTLPSQVWWMVGIVFYLVVIDNNFKVTLRQPYPGIFAYFLWGLLLSRLREPSHLERGAS
jgi:hypothetical protein